MTGSPFDIFTIKNIIITKNFIFNSIHLQGFLLILFTLIISFFFKKSNFIYNSIFFSIELIEKFLEVNIYKENKKHVPFFFMMIFIMFMGNILARIPGMHPVNSLLKVSIPLNVFMIIYFIYAAIKNNFKNFITAFFNPKVVLPMRILIGIIEIFSFLSKIFSFSMRLLANLTAGHILMWVIENFVKNSPFFLKPLPLFFLIFVYLIEIFSCFLQTYVFLILSTNTFKSININH